MLIEFSHRFAESAGISDYFTCVSIVLSLEIYIILCLIHEALCLFGFLNGVLK